MARPEKPKTLLGQRLIDMRKALGFAKRADFALVLTMPIETLANYERGDRDPPIDFLSILNSRFSTNLAWLINGSGGMFEDPAKAVLAQADFEQKLMERMARVVVEVHRAMGINLQPTRLAGEAAMLFNEFRKYGIDLANDEDVEANIPRLRLSLKRRIEQAAADPTSGKSVAS